MAITSGCQTGILSTATARPAIAANTTGMRRITSYNVCYTKLLRDYTGIIRAAASNLLNGGKKQGASTITQQVARNFFLTSEKTYTRKLYEALLSLKIENNLSKDQILELYINHIFLGQRAYRITSYNVCYTKLLR